MRLLICNKFYKHYLLSFKSDYPGLMTVEEAAAKYHVGPATMAAWHLHGFKKGIMIGGALYFPIKQTEERGNDNVSCSG